MSGGDSISNIKQSNEREVRYEKALRFIRDDLTKIKKTPLDFVPAMISGLIDFIGDALYE